MAEIVVAIAAAAGITISLTTGGVIATVIGTALLSGLTYSISFATPGGPPRGAIQCATAEELELIGRTVRQ